MSTQTVILASMTVAVSGNAISAVVESDNRSEMAPAIKVGAAGLALTVGLLVVSEFQPKIASSVAILLMVASLLGPKGTALFDAIMRAVNGGKPSNKRVTSGGGTAPLKI